MRKLIITESQYKRLFESGSNSVAMDLDIYTQPMQTDTNNGNLDIIDSTENIVDKLEELISMFKSGKKISTDFKGEIYKILDDLNLIYNEIKYED